MTRRKNDKHMTKEREAEIRKYSENFPVDTRVAELLAEIDEARRINDHLLKVNTQQAEVIRHNKWDELLAEIDALRSEIDEQCRLNGMGGSRELKLMGQVQKKDKELERLKASLACRGVHTCHDQCLNPQCLMRKELAALNADLDESEAIMVALKEQLEKILIKVDWNSDEFNDSKQYQETMALVLSAIRKIIGEEK